MLLIDVLCIALGAWALGLFTAFMLYGFFEGQSDRYANIPWRKTLDTTIDWSTRKPHYRRDG